jgi:hypothetical protein
MAQRRCCDPRSATSPFHANAATGHEQIENCAEATFLGNTRL